MACVGTSYQTESRFLFKYFHNKKSNPINECPVVFKVFIQRISDDLPRSPLITNIQFSKHYRGLMGVGGAEGGLGHFNYVTISLIQCFGSLRLL